MYIEWQVGQTHFCKGAQLKLPPRTPETPVSMVAGHIGIMDSMNKYSYNANTAIHSTLLIKHHRRTTHVCSTGKL